MLWNPPRRTTKEQIKKMPRAYKSNCFQSLKRTTWSFTKKKTKKLEILILRKLSQSFWDLFPVPRFYIDLWNHVDIYDRKLEVEFSQGSKGPNGRGEGQQTGREGTMGGICSAYNRHMYEILKNNEKVSCIKRSHSSERCQCPQPREAWSVFQVIHGRSSGV